MKVSGKERVIQTRTSVWGIRLHSHQHRHLLRIMGSSWASRNATCVRNVLAMFTSGCCVGTADFFFFFAMFACRRITTALGNVLVWVSWGWTVGASNPGWWWIFFSSSKRPDWLLELTQPPLQLVPVFFPGDKAAGALNNHSPLLPRSRMSGALLPICAFMAWTEKLYCFFMGVL